MVKGPSNRGNNAGFSDERRESQPQRRRSKLKWVAGGLAALFVGAAVFTVYSLSQYKDQGPGRAAPSITATGGVKAMLQSMATKYWPATTGAKAEHRAPFNTAAALVEQLKTLSGDYAHESGWNDLDNRLRQGPGTQLNQYYIACWSARFATKLQNDPKFVDALNAVQGTHPDAKTIIATMLTDFTKMRDDLHKEIQKQPGHASTAACPI